MNFVYTYTKIIKIIIFLLEMPPYNQMIKSNEEIYNRSIMLHWKYCFCYSPFHVIAKVSFFLSF